MPYTANEWIALILLAGFFLYLAMIAFGFLLKHKTFGRNCLKYGKLLGAIHMASLTIVFIAIAIKFVSPIIAIYGAASGFAAIKLFDSFMKRTNT